jgi:antitoxin component HigA of HigAB toxin-antitoxin module
MRELQNRRLLIVAHLRYRVHFQFAPPDPMAAILFRMEQQGLRQKDVPVAFVRQARPLFPDVKWP